MNVLGPIILILILLSIIFVSKKRSGYLLNPWSLFFGLWLVAFILFYGSDFVNHNLSGRSFAVCFLGLGGFFLGLLFPVSKNKSNNSQNFLLSNKDAVITGKIVNFSFWLTIIIEFCVLAFASMKVGLITYFSNIIHFHENEFSPGGFLSLLYKIVLYLKRTTIVFSSFAIINLFSKKPKRMKAIVVLILSILMSLAYERPLVLYLVIVDILTFYFCLSQIMARRKIKKRGVLKTILKTLIISAGGIAAIVLFFSFSQKVLNKTFELDGSIFGFHVSDNIATFISYFMGTIKSSDLYLQSVDNRLPFIATFRLLYDFFGVDTTTIFAQDFVYIPFSYNTSYYQYYLFMEGGYIWVFIASLIFGLISNYCFTKMRKEFYSLNIVPVVLIFLAIILSTRSYLLLYFEFLIPVVTLLVIKLMFGKTYVGLRKNYFQRNGALING